MHLFFETRTVRSIVDCNGGGSPALCGPLALVMGALKIHRPVARYAGLSNQALKLARRVDVMKTLWRSRFSFFDFARSLTLSR